MIPVNRPLIRSHRNKFIEYALKTKWVSETGHSREIREKFCKKNRYEIFNKCYHGTSALEIAIFLNLKSGDYVMLPNLTIVSCLVNFKKQSKTSFC